MCIRSQHGDITAWCATFESDITPRTSPSTTTSKNKTTHANHNSKNFNFSHTSSTRTFRFPSSLRVHKNIAICLLLTTSFLVLPDEVDSAVMFPRKSIANYEDFQYLPLPASVTKPINRKRLKRSSVDRPMRNPWSADLVTYVCDELKDPCTRAKFLRLHTYHDICSDLPPLYLLPHVDNEQLIQNYSSVKLCSASDKGWRSTDGLYRGYLETSESCRNNLNALDLLIRSSLKGDLDMFVDILEHSFCTIPANNSLLEECAQCQVRPFHTKCSSLQLTVIFAFERSLLCNPWKVSIVRLYLSALFVINDCFRFNFEHASPDIPVFKLFHDKICLIAAFNRKCSSKGP